MTNDKKAEKFDLEIRTTEFAKKLLLLCKKESITIISKPIIDQLLRSSTSVGANYREANGADSKKDFRNKISICKKEAKETMYWLELLSTVSPNKDDLRILWKESHDLTLIFSSISRKLRD